MTEELRQQIYRELDLKETDDLLEIWQTNDHVEWSDQAFDAIREILSKRLGQVPHQGEAITVHESADAGGLEDWEETLLDDEDQPELYDVLDVLALRDNINRVVVAVVVIDVLLWLLNQAFIRNLFDGIFPTAATISQGVPNMIISGLSFGLSIVIVIVPLKGLVQVLRILMQMEFNSRKPLVTRPVAEN